MSENKALKDDELNNVAAGGSVKTGWAPCSNYVQVQREVGIKLCGNCRYCDRFSSGFGGIFSEDANCHYPDMVQ